jgi:DNA modification methylase
MTPYYADRMLTVYSGDCREVMAAMEPESVQCVVTSPPYLGLRDYGIEPTVWGGEAHEHEWGGSAGVRSSSPQQSRNGQQGVVGPRDMHPSAQRTAFVSSMGNFCPCGAWLGVLGLEPTIELYVAHLVEIFRGVRRVLRKDGTVWLNMGDSYASGTKGSGGDGTSSGLNCKRDAGGGFHPEGHANGASRYEPRRMDLGSLKPKDRMMVPARVALELQADGWWLRDEIVWAKPNPMPSSVTDRTTPAHEMVYLLTRSARYFYDAEAIKEAAINEGRVVSYDGSQKNTGHENNTYPGSSGPRDILVSGRNKRSVWTIPTAPYPEAHFATFPPKLVEPMILAGTSERGCCPECGVPWDRETTKVRPDLSQFAPHEQDQPWNDESDANYAAGRLSGQEWNRLGSTETTGWHPTCKHRPRIPLTPSPETAALGIGDATLTLTPRQLVPCVVLDPFGGSGTVGMVSRALGRRSILIDLNSGYLAQMLKRATVEWDNHEPEPVVDKLAPDDSLWRMA